MLTNLISLKHADCGSTLAWRYEQMTRWDTHNVFCLTRPALPAPGMGLHTNTNLLETFIISLVKYTVESSILINSGHGLLLWFADFADRCKKFIFPKYSGFRSELSLAWFLLSSNGLQITFSQAPPTSLQKT